MLLRRETFVDEGFDACAVDAHAHPKVAVERPPIGAPRVGDLPCGAEAECVVVPSDDGDRVHALVPAAVLEIALVVDQALGGVVVKCAEDVEGCVHRSAEDGRLDGVDEGPDMGVVSCFVEGEWHCVNVSSRRMRMMMM